MNKPKFSVTHLVVAGVIFLAALLSLWLVQAFGTVLYDLTASQLLEQEQRYLQRDSGLAPSRAYFQLHQGQPPSEYQMLPHDNAIFVVPDTQLGQSSYGIALPHTANTSAQWLQLDIAEALPLADFLLWQRLVCSLFVALFGGIVLYLLYRLHRSQQQLQHAFERERNFVNDISHELRTPLSLIQNVLTLAQQNALTENQFALLKEASSTMAQQLSVLLALARKQQTPTQQMDLHVQLEQAMFSLYQTEPQFVSQIQLDLPTPILLSANPQLLQLLLVNIINNACYHSGGAALAISYQEGILRFCNQIKRQADGSVPKTANYQGFGHGSSLIQRIADELSWPLSVQSNAQTYQVTLQLG